MYSAKTGGFRPFNVLDGVVKEENRPQCNAGFPCYGIKSSLVWLAVS